MQVDFNVGQPPPSDDQIEHARSRLEANIQLGQRALPLVLLGAVLSAGMTYLILDAAFAGVGVDLNEQTPLPGVLIALLSRVVKIVLAVASFSGVIKIFRDWGRQIESNLSMLEPLPPQGIDAANQRFADLREAMAYMSAVKAMRQLKIGDFHAMERFAQQRHGSE
ncbi:hypothetical protein ABIC83_002392 [Roseateles asaccharophilus]|uniref:hypothetical protein n=1 Tax=Roseateles asaccharophilus TaxID=582607 RepID=UPI003832C8B4